MRDGAGHRVAPVAVDVRAGRGRVAVVRPAVVRALVVALLDRAVRPARGAVGEARVEEVAREVIERGLAAQLARRLLEELRRPRISRRRLVLAAGGGLAHALAAPAPVRLLHEPGGAAAHAATPVAGLRSLALLGGRVGVGGARRLPG